MKKGLFGKLIGCILTAVTLGMVFALAFVCALRWSSGYFAVSGKKTEAAWSTGTVQDVTEPVKPLPEVAVQAVFVTDENGVLCVCFYTVLDCLNGTMEFYTAPMDTRLQLSTELYRELVTKNAMLAQVNTLGALYGCFPVEDAPECTVKALDEAVGVKADYYTVMPMRCYERLMKEEAHEYPYDTFFQDNLTEQVMAAGSMKAYLTGLWRQCESSVSVESRLYYLETYEGLTNIRVSCRQIAGERHNNGYELAGTGMR